MPPYFSFTNRNLKFLVIFMVLILGYTATTELSLSSFLRAKVFTLPTVFNNIKQNTQSRSAQKEQAQNKSASPQTQGAITPSQGTSSLPWDKLDTISQLIILDGLFNNSKESAQQRTLDIDRLMVLNSLFSPDNICSTKNLDIQRWIVLSGLFDPSFTATNRQSPYTAIEQYIALSGLSSMSKCSSR